MRKKKILFMLSKMNVGGVEKAFLGMLTAIPASDYDIHLALLGKNGGYLNAVPNYVTIHEVSCFSRNKRFIMDPPQTIIKSCIKKFNFCEALIHLILAIYFKLTSNRYWFYQYIMRKEPMLPGEYDMAVAYPGPSQMIDWYVNKRVNAKARCSWIHFDILKFGIDRGMTKKLYKNFKKIFVVSQTGKAIFDKTFPEFVDKTEVFLNIVSPHQVIEQSNQSCGFTDDFDGKRILTVGRISPEKGQTVAIEALRLLCDTGCNVKWYFVGDGVSRRDCERLAARLGVADKVVFLGTQTNPYPYMAQCDVYMQPSRREGYCITLAEARCFGAPIVATDFTGAAEQLSTRANGIIVGMDAASIADGISKAINLHRERIFNTKENTPPNINRFLDIIP
jgi:glycosyltransferase involved in cell wall biosynthesis